MAEVKNSIRVAVCDDCKSDRDFLRESLKTYKAENPALFEIEEFESGEALLANGAEQYDLIFLDIYMGQMTGMDTAGELRRRGVTSKLVFCSTSSDFAAESYDVAALYYLVKPYEKEKLYGVLDRFIKDFPQLHSIQVKVGRDMTDVYLKDIVYVEANNKKCIIHTGYGALEASITMAELGELLREPEFVRPIRYAIVSMKEVVSVPTDVIKLSCGVEIPVSRGKRQDMKKAFAEYRWMLAKKH